MVFYRTDLNNPLWLQQNTLSGSEANRTFMKVGITYKITDFLNLSYRVGYDQYTTESFFEKTKVVYPQADWEGSTKTFFQELTLTTRYF